MSGTTPFFGAARFVGCLVSRRKTGTTTRPDLLICFEGVTRRSFGRCSDCEAQAREGKRGSRRLGHLPSQPDGSPAPRRLSR